MMRIMLMLLSLFAGCGDSDPSTQPQSKSVTTNTAGGGKVDLSLNLEGPKPISRPRLIELWPKLSELNDEQLQSFSSAVNIIPSPCPECGTLPMAHCFEKGNRANCPVLGKLFNRAANLAGSDRPQVEIKGAINYPDLWFSEMGEGNPPLVTLYTDEAGPLHTQTSAMLAEMKAEFGDKVRWNVIGSDTKAPEHLDVRSRPTWFVNGHRFRGAQSTRTLKRFVALEFMGSDK